MNTKMKGVLILGVVLLATVATLSVMPASAAMNGDVDQLQDRDRDCTQDKDCSCDCLPDQTQTRTRLQIQDCKPVE